jgi:glycosyltransferase involved in cell wall biosynthesis
MRIAIIATRLSGTDGVSLETAKWAAVLTRMGHEIFYAAGELSGFARQGLCIPRMHFLNEDILIIQEQMFKIPEISTPGSLIQSIKNTAFELKSSLKDYILSNHIDQLIIENALAIPMNLPLGVALMDLISELKMPTIAHHHDFFWERDRFQNSLIPEILEDYFPGNTPDITHVTINSLAQNSLKNRKGFDSKIIPNVYDFSVPTPGIDFYNSDLRKTLGFSATEAFILQPTRVIQRKGIEFAIELVHRLKMKTPRLIISHAVGDEGSDYWRWLKQLAQHLGVSLEVVNDKINDQRWIRDGQKIYSLGDAYLNADLVTYPSIYEGFGNALLEDVYYKRPMLINRYLVYISDIQPKGFKFIEMDHKIEPAVVDQVSAIIHSPETWKDAAEHNFAIAKEHYSFERLEHELKALVH